MLTEKILKHLGPALITRQDRHPVVLLQIELHILRSGLGAAGVGGELLCGDAGEGFGREGISAHGEGVRHIHRVVLQTLGQRLKAQIKAVRAHGQKAPAVQLFDILAQLLCVIPGPLRAAVGLVQDHNDVRRDVIRAGGHGVNDGQIAVRIGHGKPVFQPLSVSAQGFRKLCRVFTAPALCIFIGKSPDLPGKSLHAARGHGGQGLRRRENDAAFYLLSTPLALHIETAHGVDLIAPELDSHRLVVKGGEKVQNTAPAGKLPGTFHLLCAGVAAAEQGVLHVLGWAALPVRDGKGGLHQRLGGHGALEQAGDGGHGHRRTAICQRIQGSNALLLPLPGSSFRGIEGEVPHSQHRRVAAEHGAQVVGKVLCRCVVRADYKNGRAGPLPQSSGEICPVYGGKAGNERRKPSALQQTGEGGGFLIFKNLVNQNVHIGGIIPQKKRIFNRYEKRHNSQF